MSDLPPVGDLVSVQEFEDVARRALPAEVFGAIAGGDRQAFDLITLRPRMLVPTLDLDLSVDLLGDTLFAPILVGPMSEQRRFHPEGELATARGAAAAKAVMVVSSRSSAPLQEIAAQAGSPFWYQVDADQNAAAAVQRGVQAGCKAVCVTLGASPSPGAPVNWTLVDRIRQQSSVPTIVKGIMTPADATAAVEKGFAAIVVSNYQSPVHTATISVLPSIVDAVAGRVPVLVDGSFRRGSDIFKALAFGAQGVLLGRPVMWGLSAYGAAGAQTVVELLQTELARVMAMCGSINLEALDRRLLKVHGR